MLTQIGHSLLISVNPNTPLPDLSLKIDKQYMLSYARRLRGDAEFRENVPMEIPIMAENAYRDLLTTNSPQSIILRGQSGSGKSEAFKILFHYFTYLRKGFSGE